MFKIQIRSAPSALLRLLTAFLFLFSFLISQRAALADSFEDAARALARKAAAVARGGTVSLELRNQSSLEELAFSRFRAIFQEEIQRHGVKILANSGGAQIVLTVAGHLTGYIAVAQIQRADGTTIEMEPLGRVVDSSPGNPQAAITLHKEFLFAEDSPILDLVFSPDGRQAFALGLQEVFSYERKGDQWVPAGTERLPIRAMSREMRGYLELGANTPTAYFPGEVCRSSSVDGKGWRCEPSRELMPARSLTASEISEKKSPPWISAVRFEDGGRVGVILTGKDGLARLYEENAEPVATFSEWGSEIAALQSECGKGWQILVTGKGDWTAADMVQAVEIQKRVAEVVSQAVEFDGPVVALRNPLPKNSTDVASATEAIAVSHDLETGRYEAYRLTLVCGD